MPFDSPGLRIEESWDHLGLRAWGSHDVVFENVRVSSPYALDLHPAGAWRPNPWQQAWSCALLSALYDGVAQAAQDWFVRYLRERVPGSLGAPLASLPRFQKTVGENERMLAVNRRPLGGLAAEVDAGHPPAPQEAGFVKLTVTEGAIAAV